MSQHNPEQDNNEQYDEDYISVESEEHRLESEEAEDITASSARAARDRGNPIMQMWERLIDRLYQGQRGGKKNDFVKIVTTIGVLGTEKFLGGDDPFVGDAWIKKLERNFEATECPEHLKRNVAIQFLDRDAAFWWRTIEDRYGQYYPAEYAWQNFKTEFLRKYFPEETRERIEIQFLELKQAYRSVREYEVEFARLRCHAKYGKEDDRVLIRKFLRGLRPDLYSRLQVVQHTVFSDAVEAAVGVEDAVRREKQHYAKNRAEHRMQQQQHRNKGHLGQNQNQVRQDEGRSSKRPRPPPVCYRCGRTGHRGASCTMTTSSPPTQVTRPVPTCWNCGETGQFWNMCPKPRITFPPSEDQRRPPQGQPQLALQRPPKRLAIEPAPHQQNQPAERRVYALEASPGTSQLQPPNTSTYGF